MRTTLKEQAEAVKRAMKQWDESASTWKALNDAYSTIISLDMANKIDKLNELKVKSK